MPLLWLWPQDSLSIRRHIWNQLFLLLSSLLAFEKSSDSFIQPSCVCLFGPQLAGSLQDGGSFDQPPPLFLIRLPGKAKPPLRLLYQIRWLSSDVSWAAVQALWVEHNPLHTPVLLCCLNLDSQRNVLLYWDQATLPHWSAWWDQATLRQQTMCWAYATLPHRTGNTHQIEVWLLSLRFREPATDCKGWTGRKTGVSLWLQKGSYWPLSSQRAGVEAWLGRKLFP